jgi:hypothetical protein
MDDPNQLMAAVKAESHWIIVAVLVLAILYVIMVALTKKKATDTAEEK